MSLSISEIVGLCSILGMFASFVYGYSRLNLESQNTKRKVDALDTKTSVAIEKLYERMEIERDRREVREDMLRDKIDQVNTNVNQIHNDLLLALRERDGN